MAKPNEETAVAPRGLGMGGLGQFTEDDFVKSVTDSEVAHGTAEATDIKDAMGNVMPKLERVKVKHGGACIFQDEDDNKFEELIGAVVAYTFHNSFFDKAFEDREDGERPPCYSNDGVSIAARAEAPRCDGGCTVCPLNRDATDREARENAFDLNRKEACNNYLSLAVALPGREVPVHVQLSNSSFKPWAAYVQRIGTQGRFKIHEVGTKFTLKNRTGPGGSEYSVVIFDSLGALPTELAASFAAQAPNYRALLRREAEHADADNADAEAAGAVAEAKAEQEKAKKRGAAL
jgi:hypothetical protein